MSAVLDSFYVDAPYQQKGWLSLKLENKGVFWYKGVLLDSSWEKIATQLVMLFEHGWFEALKKDLAKIDGHFAFIYDSQVGGFAVVDRLRTIPLFIRKNNEKTIISPDSLSLAYHDSKENINQNAALSFAMAGYTIGNSTLHDKVFLFDHGEAYLWKNNEGGGRLKYYQFQPWKVDKTKSDDEYSSELLEITLDIFKRVIGSANGRRIVVPLSAGVDSRLIASCLRALNYDNVLCIAYGLPDNHEAVASQKIANKLGFDWEFISMTPHKQRQFWKTKECQSFLKYADGLFTTPVVHDLPVMMELLEKNVVKLDDILINGGTGDFISGMHIPYSLVEDQQKVTSFPEACQKVLNLLINKHFRLWGSLVAPENDSVIEKLLLEELSLFKEENIDEQTIHGLYEYLEFQNRQSKYAISRQRIYEFLDLEWQLPLWNKDYLEFWQKVPSHLKLRQCLYRETLIKANWGGVWQGPEWNFERYISPNWMRNAVRPVCKALCAPVGKKAWHRFEKRFLLYWMDVLGWQGIIPYLQVVTDKRKARHFVAWHTELYLNRKGLHFDGRQLGY